METARMNTTPEQEVLYFENKSFGFGNSSSRDNTHIDVNADISEELILKAKNSLLKKEHDEALEACQIIIDLDPNYSEAYVGQGYTYLDMGLRKSGIRSLKKAARLGNDNAIEFLRLEESSRLERTKA
jgi:tetratricopeptide (TPR) repeat protein